MLTVRWVFFGASCLALVGMLACSEPTLQEAKDYDYLTQPIAILNTDWGVIPLPNDFLNPVRQSKTVNIPGVRPPREAPEGMALPIVDAEAAAQKEYLGYPGVEDPPLTKALLAGMNKLNGFITSFAPNIPFNRPVDAASIVPFDGGNASEANMFFMDITDAENPVVIQPNNYLRLFNWEQATEMPYKLYLRFPAAGFLQPPKDFEPGHTYAVVMTGWTDNGVKDSEGNPFKSDGSFLVFAQEDIFPETGTAYIGPDGSSRNSVVPDLAMAQQAEGARQLTNQVLKVWEGLDGIASSGWTRQEVIVAFSFTTATNPMPNYFDAVKAFFGQAAVVPQPSDAIEGTDGISKAKADCSPKLTFTLDKPVAPKTVNNKTVRLFKVDGQQYTEVGLIVTAKNDEALSTVEATPTTALEPQTLYLAAVTNGIRSLDGLAAATDQTYFGLTRAALKAVDEDGNWSFTDTPLVAQNDKGELVWQSAHLDSRLDTLILNGATQDADVDDDALASAGETLVNVLSYLEGMRKIYKPHIDWLVLGNDGKPGIPGQEGVDNVVAEREDLVLVWTFTTGACEQ